MALLQLLKVDDVLGGKPELETFKRGSDKVDLLLTLGLLAAGVTLFSLAWGQEDAVLCVPASCASHPTNTSCARKWEYQSSLCEDEVLSWPDANLPYLLPAVFLGLLGLPLYWGNPDCRSLFTSFHAIWENPPVQEEERRSLHLLLEQLRSGTVLSSHYALFHALGLLADLLSLLLLTLYSFHFADEDVSAAISSFLNSDSPTAKGLSSYFTVTKTTCNQGAFVCEQPLRSIYLWFCLASTILVGFKTVVNLRCLLFSLALPGFCGRRFLLYMAALTDSQGERLYTIQSNPVLVVLRSLLSILRRIFLLPLFRAAALCRMCCVRGQKKAQKSLSSGVSSLRRVVGHQNDPEEVEVAAYEEMEGLDQDDDSPDSKMESEWRKPRVSSKAQNWCDLFFILDILASSMDTCHVLVFLGRIDSHLHDLAQTEVDLEASVVDPELKQMTVRYKDGGVIEELLGLELSGEGGLRLVGWLETDQGVTWPLQEPGDCLVFPCPSQPVTVVAALFGRASQIAKMRPCPISLSQDVCRQRPWGRKGLLSLADALRK